MVWYDRDMKKLLVLLLLSPLAFAEPININCEYYQTINMKTADVSAISEREGFTIKPDTKKIIASDGTFTYDEEGNQITWTTYSPVDVGDVYGMAWVFRIDRVSGELEQDFRELKKTEGFDMQDLLKDAEDYEHLLTHYAKCNKVEALF